MKNETTSVPPEQTCPSDDDSYIADVMDPGVRALNIFHICKHQWVKRAPKIYNKLLY